MTNNKMTHKGWYLFCPIYMGGLDSDDLIVEARHWSIEWMFTLAGFIDGARIFLTTVIDPSYEPMFGFKVTGKL